MFPLKQFRYYLFYIYLSTQNHCKNFFFVPHRIFQNCISLNSKFYSNLIISFICMTQVMFHFINLAPHNLLHLLKIDLSKNIQLCRTFFSGAQFKMRHFRSNFLIINYHVLIFLNICHLVYSKLYCFLILHNKMDLNFT